MSAKFRGAAESIKYSFFFLGVLIKVHDLQTGSRSAARSDHRIKLFIKNDTLLETSIEKNSRFLNGPGSISIRRDFCIRPWNPAQRRGFRGVQLGPLWPWRGCQRVDALQSGFLGDFFRGMSITDLPACLSVRPALYLIVWRQHPPPLLQAVAAGGQGLLASFNFFDVNFTHTRLRSSFAACNPPPCDEALN